MVTIISPDAQKNVHLVFKRGFVCAQIDAVTKNQFFNFGHGSKLFREILYDTFNGAQFFHHIAHQKLKLFFNGKV
jgi:hypothetical protein